MKRLYSIIYYVKRKKEYSSCDVMCWGVQCATDRNVNVYCTES